MSIESDLLSDSLDELSKTSSTAVAKVKRKTGAVRKKDNKESAASLLDSILDDSGKAAAEEELKKAKARKAAEEEAAKKKEEEELLKRLEGEAEILRAEKAQADLRKSQVLMAAAVQREKDIEAGLIDVEAEERAKREEELRKKREEEEKARKAQEKKERKERLAKQKAELLELQHQEAIELAKPKPSKVPYILMAAVLFITIVGGISGYFLTREEIDIYALSTKASSTSIEFQQDNVKMLALEMNRDIDMVSQGAPKAPPKPATPGKRKPSGGSGSASAAPSAPKPSLSNGKGGLFGGKSKGGGLGGRL